MIERDWTAAKENQGERQGRQRHREFVARRPKESIVNMHFRDGNGHVDENGESGSTGEKTDENQQASEELCKRREICGPARQAETRHKLNVVMKSAENFVITVDSHNYTQRKAHHEQGKRLQTIEVAQVIPPCENNLAYSTAP